MTACALSAQQNPSKPASGDSSAAPAGQQKSKDSQPAAAPTVTPDPVDKRVFGVIPNNRTTSAMQPYHSITARRKLTIAMKDSFDWPPYLTGALFAGLYQLEDQNPSFGQGMAGYFRRFGTASADQVSGNMMTEGFIPALFHQDPRYFLIGPGNGTFKHRLWHSLTATLVAPMDSGRKTFNFSEWGGNAMSVALSNSYYPDTRNAGDNAQKLLIGVATDTFSNVAKEFWPDVKGWLSHKHSHAADRLAPAGH